MKNDDYLPIIGQGSQPQEADGAELAFMSLPKQMTIYSMPQVSTAISPEETAQVKNLLLSVLNALENYQPGQNQNFHIHDLTTQALSFLNEILGEGEVSIIQDDKFLTKIQESVLAGVWRIQCFDPQTNDLYYDGIEIGDIPDTIKNNTFAETQKQLQFNEADLPDGLMNALPLIAELNDKINTYSPTQEAHIINLSLLPQSDQDLEFLYQLLGKGTVSILSRSYGTNRITSTATNNVWWVQYFNSSDTLILNTLEVSKIPGVACAAPEDLADSAERLGEILQLY